MGAIVKAEKPLTMADLKDGQLAVITGSPWGPTWQYLGNVVQCRQSCVDCLGRTYAHSWSVGVMVSAITVKLLEKGDTIIVQ